MKSNFDIVLPLLLKDEGGYCNDPGDNGGPTKYGITIHDVQLYIKKNATASDVKSLTLDEAKDIYKHKYWDSLDCDNLPSGVDYTVFDYGVNSGVGRPRKALQQFKSLSGSKLIDAINNERTAFLTSISDPSNPKYAHNTKFRAGWLARVNRVRTKSQQLVQKKDNVTGPASAGAAGLTFFATISQYIHDHPYVVIASSVGGAILVGTLIHLYRNRNK